MPDLISPCSRTRPGPHPEVVPPQNIGVFLDKDLIGAGLDGQGRNGDLSDHLPGVAEFEV